jgi:hypothetical protein
MINSTAYLNGKEAFIAADEKMLNPYAPETSAYDSWEEGYYAGFCEDNPHCNAKFSKTEDRIPSGCPAANYLMHFRRRPACDLA